MSFANLGLSADVLRAVADAGYVTPTPIQEQAIPVVLTGRDVLGCAQTGTGKTAGFTLPMIDMLAAGRARARMPRSLILEPTRELAAQVAENFAIYGKHHKLSMALLIGGVAYADQEKKLDRGVDVLIATPGRLIDHFERGRILLNDVKLLVIDEADRMLDMGFIPDVEKIVGLLPPLRQTLFFSATMPPEIRRLADAFLSNPKEITVSPPTSAAVTVTQGLVVVDEMDKRETLRRLIRSEEVRNALIFCNRKRDVDILYRSLKRHGFNAAALHGDMDQMTRTETLEAFKANQITLLVASDVAARGLDIDDLSHVFNFDVPMHAEDYIHRIGRTGRAGKSGRAFTIAAADDGKFVGAIETLIGREVPRITVEGIETAVLGAGDGRRGRRRAPPARQRSSEGRGRGRMRVIDGDGQAAPRDKRPERPPVVPVPAVAPIPIAAIEPPRQPALPPVEHDMEPAEITGGRVVSQPPAAPGSRGQPNRAGHRDRRHGDHRHGDDDRAVVGLGDHVPAFLMRGRKTGT